MPPRGARSSARCAKPPDRLARPQSCSGSRAPRCGSACVALALRRKAVPEIWCSDLRTPRTATFRHLNAFAPDRAANSFDPLGNLPPPRPGTIAAASPSAPTRAQREAAMKRCQMMTEVGRRKFLTGAGLAAAGAAATVAVPQAQGAPAPARVDYPSNRLANVKDLKPNEPFNVSYPDKDAPGVLLKLGKRVADGIGPEGDIVGFSTICPHKGFPLAYNKT